MFSLEHLLGLCLAVQSISAYVLARLVEGAEEPFECTLFPLLDTMPFQTDATVQPNANIKASSSSHAPRPCSSPPSSSPSSQSPSPKRSKQLPAKGWLPRVLRVGNAYGFPPVEHRLLVWLVVKQTARSFALRELLTQCDNCLSLNTILLIFTTLRQNC